MDEKDDSSVENPKESIVDEDEPSQEFKTDSCKRAEVPTIRFETDSSEGPSTRERDRLDPEELAEGGGTAPDFSTRRESVALQRMDKEHAWLAEVEEKSARLETAFISKIQYVALSNHYQKYLEQLKLQGEAGEFANLFDKFRTCFVSGQRLHYKLLQMKSQKALTDNENRDLKKKLYDGQQEVDALKSRVESAWNETVERDKEKVAILQELKEEISKSGNRPEEEESEEEITKKATGDTEDEQKIRVLEEMLETLQSDLKFSKEREAIYLDTLNEADRTKASLQTEFTSAKSELQKQTTRREKAEQVASETSEKLNKKREQIRDLTLEAQGLKAELERSRSKSYSLMQELRKFQKKFDSNTQELEKLRRDLITREDSIQLLMSQRANLESVINAKHSEIVSLKVDNNNFVKQKNELARKVTLLEDNTIHLEARVQSLKDRNVSQQKVMDALDKEHTENERKIKELTKEKDEILADYIKRESMIVTLHQDIKASEEKLTTTLKNLDASIVEVRKLNDVIQRQEREKDQMAAEALELNRSISELRNDIKGLEQQLTDSEKITGKLRKELEDSFAKYRSLAEDERYYRNSCADANRKLEKQNEQMTMLDKNIQQLKSYNFEMEEQKQKVEEQLKSAFDHLRSNKETLKQEAKNNEELSRRIQKQDELELGLLKKMSDLEHVIRNLTRKVKNLTEEKGVLSARVLEREGQITSNKERMRLLENDLTVLDGTLQERVDDIKLLKLQLSEMYRGHSLMEGRVENMQTTRQELVEVQRELQDEKLKSKRMEVEVQRPINFHRWRILEGTDPDRAHLVTKTHALQKQLIQKTSELDAKEVEIREQEQVIRGLREMVRRRSDDSIEEQVADCRRELKSRMDRLKCLTAENNMYESLVGKYRKEVVTLRDELKKYKMAEFELRTRPKRKRSAAGDMR